MNIEKLIWKLKKIYTNIENEIWRLAINLEIKQQLYWIYNEIWKAKRDLVGESEKQKGEKETFLG